MKRLLQRRVLPLLCCLSLTVGLFSYQPPKAKALLTEASLATSVIWTFMQSAGLSFSGNNAGSQEWIDSCQHWYNKFMETKGDAANGFVGWLGYNSWGEFLKDIKYQQNSVPSLGYKLFIPKAISSKLAEFTQWFIGELGLTSGGESKPVVSTPGGYRLSLADGDFIALGSYLSTGSAGLKYYTPGSILFDVTKDMYDHPDSYAWEYKLSNGIKLIFKIGGSTNCSLLLESYNADGSYRGGCHYNETYNAKFFYYGSMRVDKVGLAIADDGNTILPILHGCYEGNEHHYGRWFEQYSLRPWGDYFTVKDLALPSSEASAIDATQPGAYNPAVDDTGDKATVVTIPGLDGDFSTIEDLLQKILDKLAANELKATGSVADTDTPDVPATDVSWKGTIEKIYNAIIDLPGRIAEAIKDLFIPHEGYATEFVSSINGIFEDRMGLLTYPLSVLSDFVGTVATLDEQEPILRWNDVVWQNRTIIQKGEYNLKSALSGTAMQSAYSVYRTVVSAVLVIAFLHLLLKKLKEVQSN